MRHRQNSGAGPSGTRPGVAIAAAVGASALCVGAIAPPGGLWLGFGLALVGSGIGFGALWLHRGALERQVKEMARRRRGDLARFAIAEQRYQDAAERLRAELEHEQQYAALVKDQLSRARRQLDEQRSARLVAEREIDALAAWVSEAAAAGPSGLLPDLRAAALEATRPHDPGRLPEPVESSDPDGSLAGSTGAPSGAGATDSAAESEPRQAVASNAVVVNTAPGVFVSMIADRCSQPAETPSGSVPWDRRAGSCVSGSVTAQGIEPTEERGSVGRPFIERSFLAVPGPVPESALALAPVIDYGADDAVLDLTAYDETVEFTVRDLRRRA